ncbi:MAG: flagellar protein FlaG [Spirochaetaceae bacterium]|jgi:uncharacterized FlaG/YvyC family protein|nr:flagellar protein FlaG [Spirochaetaceae bacterium]
MNLLVSSDGRFSQTQKIEQKTRDLKEAYDFKRTSPEHITQPAEEISSEILKLNAVFKRLQFAVDQNTGQVTVKVIDANTDKVIKILPPKELQRLSRRAQNESGFLLNEFA